MIALLLVLAQGSLPTVGDTLWASRSVRVAPGDSVRAPAWELDGAVQLLGRAEITVSGDRAQVRYPLVAWEAGNHQLDVPGPIITRATGVEDTLPSQSMTFQVLSVLPAGVPDSQLRVQPPAVPVPRGFRSLLPVIVLGALAALALLPLHWWWRRRGPPAPVPPLMPSEGPPDDMVRRWADAGERRIVAGVTSLRLRQAIARKIPAAHAALDTATLLEAIASERPDWPHQDLRTTLLALDRLRYAPAVSDNGLELYHQGIRLADQISGVEP